MTEIWRLVLSRMFCGRYVVRVTPLLCLGLFFSLLLGNTGAEWNPTGNPIGGGPGYSDSVRLQDVDFFVTTKTELLNAVSVAAAGQIVYVNDNAEIDLTGSQLFLSRGITLASGRGKTIGDSISWGGLIYCTEHIRSDELIRVGAKNIRITGLRLRGGFSQLEGMQVASDTFAQPLPTSYYGIYVTADTVEVDNCEIWGFSGAPVAGQNCLDVQLHHDYFHNGEHCYHAYGINFWGNTTYYNIANFTDYQQWLVMSGGGNCMPTRGYHAWCIFGHHTFSSSFYAHDAYGYDSCAYDSIYNCSFYTTGYTHGHRSGYSLSFPARDTVFVRDSWFKNDSVKSISIATGASAQLINNHYSPTAPSGVAGRIPVPSITCDVDSGTAPLTVTFNACQSYDPDGEIIAFYWTFGDSLKPNNYVRYADQRSVSHTFSSIGKYLVELMVVDDHGIVNYAYKTINVAPSDNRKWLSCWIKDRYYDRATGCYKKQIVIDDQVCWENDLAGNGSWEHVIIDVTDQLEGKSCIDLAFRLKCVRDTAVFWQPMLYVDDIVIYGANVVNGDFESGTWTGNVYSRTDGHWQGSRYGTQYIYAIDFEMDVHSGKRAFYLGTMWNPHYAGDWAKVEQTVDVSALGIGVNVSGVARDLHRLSLPYPNPALKGVKIHYSLNAQYHVSMNIYDVCGRLVRALCQEEQAPGEYDVYWDGVDEQGRSVPSGAYLCNLATDSFNETKRITLLR